MLATIGRTIWVAIAAVLAAIAGGGVLFLLGAEHLTRMVAAEGDSTRDITAWLDLLDRAGPVLALLAKVSVLPALIVLIIGEVGRIRSLTYYLAGGAIAAAGVPLVMRLTDPAAAAAPSALLLNVMATAGIAAGLVYWLLAGRRA